MQIYMLKTKNRNFKCHLQNITDFKGTVKKKQSENTVGKGNVDNQDFLLFFFRKNSSVLSSLSKTQHIILDCPSTKTFNPFPNKPWFLRVCSTSLLKTLLAKEKWLVTSIFFLFPPCFLFIWRTFCHFHQI